MLIRNLKFLGKLFVIGFLISSCSRSTVRSHGWTKLTFPESTESGYAMYTYVLVNRDLNNQFNNELRDRFNSLASAIVNSLPPADTLEASGIDRETMNLFLIPASIQITTDTTSQLNNSSQNNLHNKRISVRSFDEVYQNSAIYLLQISKLFSDLDLIKSVISNSGPYLISVKKPLSILIQEEKEFDILYVDLSTTHPSAMTELIAAYKIYLIDNEIDGFQKFNSLRLDLLTIMLDANDYVKIVRGIVTGGFLIK